MNYKVLAHKWVAGFLNKLDKKEEKRIQKAIRELAKFPSLPGIKHLFDDVYRKRAGMWRIFFKVYPEKSLIVVFDIQPRDRAYESLRRTLKRVK